MLRLYTDESPGLKVDPVVVLVLSLGFIMSVVALHSESRRGRRHHDGMQHGTPANRDNSHCQDHPEVLIDTKKTFTIVVIIWAAFVAEGTGLDCTGRTTFRKLEIWAPGLYNQKILYKYPLVLKLKPKSCGKTFVPSAFHY
jgi:hypothetical protein